MFANRVEAGRRLGAELVRLHEEDPIVLGLPRGGVPVAAEVARALDAPLDIVLVRKVGVPFQPELGMGAIGEGGTRVLDASVMRRAGVTDDEFRAVETRERAELARRTRRYRGDTPPLSLTGRTVIIVDDGLATGGTARVAIEVARARGATRVVLAVPVAPPDTTAALRRDADLVVVLATPANFRALGTFYDDFQPTDDKEVIRLLHARPQASETRPGEPPERSGPQDSVGVAPDTGLTEVRIKVDHVELPGLLDIPASPRGIVIFAHGSGSSRHSARNRMVAGRIRDAGIATLLFDLLSEHEAADPSLVFDVELLASRLLGTTRWVERHSALGSLPLGYFGASTGAAAALWTAAESDLDVRAVVSRGGRPDLANPRLGAVRCPTLLIVGGADPVVLRLNRQAAARLRCPHRLEIVPGATHLFEEPGALEAVADLAAGWFVDHLTDATTRAVRSPDMANYGLAELSRSECIERLRHAALGRLGVTVDAVPTVLPVWITVIDDRVVFRTVPGTKLEAASTGAVVALEVDDFDAASREGWSVLVRGLATQVDDPAIVGQARATLIDTWIPDASAEHFVSITLDVVTGRRVHRR